VVGADSELARSYCLETTNYASVIELARWEELGTSEKQVSRSVLAKPAALYGNPPSPT